GPAAAKHACVDAVRGEAFFDLLAEPMPIDRVDDRAFAAPANVVGQHLDGDLGFADTDIDTRRPHRLRQLHRGGELGFLLTYLPAEPALLKQEPEHDVVHPATSISGAGVADFGI